MSVTSFDIRRLASVLVEATLNPSQWNTALETIAKETGSFGSMIFPLDRRPNFAPSTVSLARAVECYFQEGWVERDIRFNGTSHLVAKGIVTDSDFISSDDRKRHPYYQDFLGRFRLSGWACVRLGYGSNSWALAIQRQYEQGQFEPDELCSLQLLSQQSQSITQISDALGLARADAAMAAFEASDKGSILLNARGDIERLNLAAEHMVGKGIYISNRKLKSCHKDADRALQSTIRSVIWTFSTVSAPPVLLPREDGLGIAAHIMRTQSVTDFPLSSFAAIVVLTDLDKPTEATINDLKAMFGLSPAEARLALALSQGFDLQSLSHRFAVSKETLRTQLRAIFLKTKVTRQQDLFALVAKLIKPQNI